MSESRFSWLRRLIQRHRVLSALLGAYLLLSAVELVRVLLYDRPREYAAGFYQPEPVTVPGGERQFRWTRGDTGYLLRPLWEPVVRIPILLSHPSPPAAGVRVRLYLDDRLFDERTFFRNGWQRLDYYLPAVLAADPWRRDPERMSLASVGELQPLAGDEPFGSFSWTLRRRPDYVRVFTDWHVPPGPPSSWFRIEADTTFVPSEFSATSDRRELGVGVGELLWMPAVSASGLGLYPQESDSSGSFHWAQQWSSQPIPEPIAEPAPVGDALVLRARVPHADAGERPVRALFYWNTELVVTLDFDSNGWRQVRLEGLQASEGAGVFSVRVSRAWNAAGQGVGGDDRDLAIALGPPRWESAREPG